VPQDDTKDDALGGQLMANDKWLVSNLFKAEQWAQGSAAELLDGSAWRRFTQRLAQLADRIYRWNLADATPVPGTRVVKLDGLRGALHPDTPEITAAARATEIEQRREHVRRRFARPL